MISPRDGNPAELIDRLLSAARQRGDRSGAPDDAVDYPFDRPNRFTRAQLDRLGRFAEAAAQAVADRLAQALQATVTLAPRCAWEQHFTGSLREAAPASLTHVAAVTDEAGAAAGWIGVSSLCASQWLARLLGGCQSPQAPEPEDAEQAGQAEEADQAEPRALSDLERDLLADVAAGIAEALQAPAAAFGLAALGAVNGLSSWPADDADDADELCLMELADAPDAPASVAILLTARLAAVLAGEAAPPKARADRAAQTPPPMLAHVERTAVDTHATLSGSVRMRDVIALSPGDVLVLDQRTDDPVDLEVDGRTVMRGHPVRQDGQVALRFAEFVKEK